MHNQHCLCKWHVCMCSCCCQWVGVCARNNVNSFNWLYIKFIVNLSLSDDSASTVCLWIFVFAYSILFLYLQTMFLLPLLINAQYFTHVFVAYFTFFFFSIHSLCFFSSLCLLLFCFRSSVLVQFVSSSSSFLCRCQIHEMLSTRYFQLYLSLFQLCYVYRPFMCVYKILLCFSLKYFCEIQAQIKRVEQQYHISMLQPIYCVRSNFSKIYNMLVYIRLTWQLIWLSFFIYRLSHIIHLSCIGSVFHLFSDQTGGRRQLEVLILSVQNEARFIRIFSPILFFVI